MVSATILHSEEDSFTKWASAHALPVATLDFSADYSDLLPLKSVVGAARVSSPLESRLMGLTSRLLFAIGWLAFWSSRWALPASPWSPDSRSPEAWRNLFAVDRATHRVWLCMA